MELRYQDKKRKEEKNKTEDLKRKLREGNDSITREKHRKVERDQKISKELIKKNIDPIKAKPKEINEAIKETLKDGFSLFLHNKDELAEQFYNIQPFFYDAKKNLFWLWNKKLYCYELIEEIELLLALKDIAQETHFQTSKSIFWVETIRALKIIGIGKKPKEINESWIQFQNKIVDYLSKEIIEATPEYFNVNPIPWKLGEEKDTPIMDKIFGEWVGKKYVKTLKEIISYCMIQDYPFHRMIILTGSGLNGKGVYQNIIRKIIGKNNVCSSELDLLIENRFEVAKLYKKLVCSMGETNFNILKNTSRIKRLTGQDLIGFEFKNKNCFDDVNYAKLIINTNSLPPTTDKTVGFYRRICLIDFPNKFSEGIDVLNRIPEEEFNNFCLQSLDHIRDIFDNGGFTNEGDIEERRKRYEEKSNPLPEFIKENYIQDINGEVVYFEFYDRYKIYLSERGFRIISKKELTRQLREEGLETKDRNIKKPDGNYTVWKHVLGLNNVINGNNVVVPLSQTNTRKGVSSTLSPLSTLFKKLPDGILMPCTLCNSVEKALFWEDKYGDLFCDDCKKSKEINK